jgi:hypothetical protein
MFGAARAGMTERRTSVGAVVRAAFDDGEGVVREAEEADYFDDGAEEGREEWGVGVEV